MNMGQVPERDRSFRVIELLREGERFEQHDLVDPVEELGAEMPPQLGHHESPGIRLDLAVGRDSVEQVVGPDV
jgi:hypothetical protein